MKNIINNLMDFGFTKYEANIYIKLVELGKANGSRLAKTLNISKSTVYNALDSMYKNGYIFMIPGTSIEYEPRTPKLLFKDLEKKFKDNLGELKVGLDKLEPKESQEFFYKFDKIDTIKNIFIDMINNSKKEIYINSDFDLSHYKEIFKSALDRNIRIIIFSFNRVMDMGLPIEIYSKSGVDENFQNPTRLMVVSDLKTSLVVTKKEDFMNAIYTNDKVFVKIIAEHIHADIYMTKISSVFKENFEENIKIKTLHEERNLIK